MNSFKRWIHRFFVDEFIDFWRWIHRFCRWIHKFCRWIHWFLQCKIQWIHLIVINKFISLLSEQSPNRERVAQTARANPKSRAHSASREGEARAHLLPRPGRAQLSWPLGYTRLPRLKCNWIKVNEFAGLLNVFYIQGSTKTNAKMISQNIKVEFIYISVRDNVKLNWDNVKLK